MKKSIILIGTVAFLVVGCAKVTPLLDKGREEVCLKEGDQWAGGKPEYVDKLADAIVQAAEMVGQELSDNDARSIAEEMLNLYCSGAAESQETALFMVLRTYMAEADASEIIWQMRVCR